MYWLFTYIETPFFWPSLVGKYSIDGASGLHKKNKNHTFLRRKHALLQIWWSERPSRKKGNFVRVNGSVSSAARGPARKSLGTTYLYHIWPRICLHVYIYMIIYVHMYICIVYVHMYICTCVYIYIYSFFGSYVRGYTPQIYSFICYCYSILSLSTWKGHGNTENSGCHWIWVAVLFI